MRVGGKRGTIAAAVGVTAAAVFAVAGARAVTVGANINITKTVGYEGEPTIAIQRTNTNNLFAAFNTLSTSAYRKSTNGGASWTTVTTPPNPAGCCDNQTAADSFGNIFLVDIDSTLQQVRLFISTNGGDVWSPLALIDMGPAPPNNVLDQPSVAVGAGSVWVTWNDAGVIKARGAAVTGLGAGAVGSFNAEQSAPGSDCSTGVCGQFGDIAVGPSGQVTVTYQSDPNISGEGPGVVYVNTDTNGVAAGGFGSQVAVGPTNVGGFDHIQAQDARTIDAEANLGYDRSGGTFNGRLYLVYTDETPDESNNTDIYVRRSTDSGSTWSAPVKVNDDATVTSQFLPHMAVDQATGSIGVTWYDARADVVNNNDVRLWGAFSADGGVSFGPNFQVSTGISTDDYPGGGTGTSVDYGDFRWSDYHASKLFPIWADNSNSTRDNPAGMHMHFDMYTAQVTPGTTGVAVQRLDARRTREGVALRWSTAQENGVAGFNLFRGDEQLNRTLIRAKAAGRALGETYRFDDRGALRGAAYVYRLQTIGLDGSRSWQGSASTAKETRLTASIAARPGVSGVFVAALNGRALSWRLIVHGLGGSVGAEVRKSRTGVTVGTLCRSCSRNASGTTSLGAAAVAALLGGAAYIDVHPAKSPTPRILARVALGAPGLEVASPKDGDTIKLPAEVVYKVSSFQVGAPPNGHLQVADAAGNSVLAIPVASQAGTATIPDTKRWLLGGPHDLTFSLVTADGSRVPNPEASITIRGVRIIGRR